MKKIISSTLDRDFAHEARVLAAKMGISRSKLINQLLGRILSSDELQQQVADDLDKRLDQMEEIYTYLFSLDYPKGLTYDLRHKTDVARGIIEKTRGDISLSVQINRFNQKIKND